MESVFKTVLLKDECQKRKPHYPSYPVSEYEIGLASSLEEAEKLISETLADQFMPPALSFRVLEIPLDCKCTGGSCLKEYLYDRDGKRIDQRLFSTVRGNDFGVFTGRNPEEIRFRQGDIVEVNTGGRMTLGFIVGVPMDKEKAAKFNANPIGFSLDDSDDTYTVLIDSSYSNCEHVSPFAIFNPMHRMHPGVRRRLMKAYNDYRTYPAVWDIANTSAGKQLDDILGEIGLGGTVTLPQFHEDDFIVSLPLKSGVQDIEIDCKKVYNNIGRVRTTLLKIAGKPAPGRAYSVRKKKRPTNGSEDGTLAF